MVVLRPTSMKMLNVMAVAMMTLTLGLMTSCSGGGKRGSKVGAQPITLEVEMLNMTDASGADGWIYEISDCVATVNGELDAENPAIVRFKSTDFQPGQTCQLRVKSAEVKPDIAFFPGEEQVLYWAREVIIGTGPRGDYKAFAELAKRFNRVTPDGFGTFTLRVDVVFPKALEAGASLYATMSGCTPDILKSGVYKPATETTGWFVFTIGIKEPVNYQCGQIHVGLNGRGMAYIGDLAEAEKVFAAEAGAKVAIPTGINLVAQELPPPPGNVDVDVGEVKTCDEGQVYDRSKAACVDAE